MVLHTGDFKMDQLPLDGRLTDLGGFARLGAEGVDLLLSDSTNAEVPGFVTSEREIAPVLDEVFAGAQQRIIVACFASHVHRVQQVLDAAADARPQGRASSAARWCATWASPATSATCGSRSVPGGLMVDCKEAEELPPDRIVLISTGSQGEPMAALSRMASRDHPIRIAEGDTVILASSLIPGNETAVYRVINGLTRWGARVVHKGNAKVHVSGHAPAGELLYVLNLVRPSNFMPVHGEWRHLRAHAELAALTGVPDGNIVIAEDGVVVDLVGRAGRDRRRGPVRLRLRGRAVGGRRHRGLAEGPPDPRRGGLHLDHHRGRLGHRQARRRRRRSTPAARASTTPRSAR